MTIRLMVLHETSRESKGVTYHTATGIEAGDEPLLQMLDYGLREEEQNYKGKLKGKTVTIKVEAFRDVFGGRPQVSGKIVEVK